MCGVNAFVADGIQGWSAVGLSDSLGAQVLDSGLLPYKISSVARVCSVMIVQSPPLLLGLWFSQFSQVSVNLPLRWDGVSGARFPQGQQPGRPAWGFLVSES